jgi:hypothetical protein
VTEQPPPAPVPASAPAPAPEAPEGKPPEWTLRRTLRTPASESWDLVGDDGERAGTLTLQYAPDAVEGVLALPHAAPAEEVRAVLGWLTDLLTLDLAAGPGGLIHWTVTSGPLDDFWRRSPGRRPTGVETDVATARARVEPALHAMFPELVTMPDGGYAVDAGSVRVFVTLRLVEGAVLVRVFSITNLDVPVDGELPAYLLGVNFGLSLGRFSLDAGRRAVWFDHVLTAEQLDDATLTRTIATVAGTADRYDDEIKARFGGRTFREDGSPVDEVAKLAEPGMAGGYL